MYFFSDEERILDLKDEKARMIYEGIDPGVASDCGKTCPYYAIVLTR
jgi:CRISPR/Cas system-associated exonuclease Cas4 (RecB family)